MALSKARRSPSAPFPTGRTIHARHTEPADGWQDAGQLTSPGGVMPPAAAMGERLLERLRATPLFKIEPTSGAW